MQGNQNRLCGPIMSNCCCDSHSTTRRVSCKKGSISSAAQTQACSPPFLLLLLLLLWDIVGFRGQTLEVEGWGYGKYADSLSTREHKGSVLGFPPPPETRFQKSAFSGAAFTGSMWTVGQNDAKHVYLHRKVFPSGWPLSCARFVLS